MFGPKSPKMDVLQGTVVEGRASAPVQALPESNEHSGVEAKSKIGESPPKMVNAPTQHPKTTTKFSPQLS